MLLSSYGFSLLLVCVAHTLYAALSASNTRPKSEKRTTERGDRHTATDRTNHNFSISSPHRHTDPIPISKACRCRQLVRPEVLFTIQNQMEMRMVAPRDTPRPPSNARSKTKCPILAPLSLSLAFDRILILCQPSGHGVAVPNTSHPERSQTTERCTCPHVRAVVTRLKGAA